MNKPIERYYENYYCPKCHKQVFKSWKICKHCSQKLDWDELQYMANGVILACGCLISNCFRLDDIKEEIYTIFLEADVTKETFENCEDDVSKDYIIRLFGGEKMFFKEMGWI